MNYSFIIYLLLASVSSRKAFRIKNTSSKTYLGSLDGKNVSFVSKKDAGLYFIERSSELMRTNVKVSNSTGDDMMLNMQTGDGPDKVIYAKRNGKDAQKFIFLSAENGVVQFQSLEGGKCIFYDKKKEDISLSDCDRLILDQMFVVEEPEDENIIEIDKGELEELKKTLDTCQKDLENCRKK